MAQYGLDFSPIVNVLGQLRQDRNHGDDVALRRDMMLANQQNMLAQRGMEEKRFGLEQQRFNILGQQHKDKLALDWYNAKKNSDLLAAQADYYRARAGGQAGTAMPMAPEAQLGMRPDGTLYEIGWNGVDAANGGGASDVLPATPFANPGFMPEGSRRESRVLGSGSTLAPSAVREHADYGKSGMTASEVPGIVVGGSGNTDRFATERLQGQRAVDAAPEGDRERAVRFMQTQQRWTLLHGQKPRAGYMYDEQGREVPKGPMSSAAATADQKERGIKFAVDELDAAEKTLRSGFAPGLGRAVASGMKELGPPGRFFNNVTGLEEKAEATSKVKGAVLQTVYALSGKQTTNKEMDNFLDQFMPLAGESDKLITSKMARLRRFLTTLQSSTKRGMVYDDAERFAINAAMRYGGEPSPAKAGDGWTTLPGGVRIREKR